MAPPLARSEDEARLYMDLRPCERCGERGFQGTGSTVFVDGELASRYEGWCGRCGSPREFTFRLPEEVRLPLDREVCFGGPEPSELLDPGEWVTVADLAANRAPVADESDLSLAAAAMEEALKFVPEGADEVPAAAFRTEDGQTAYQQEPGRFRRDRLAAVAATYRGLATRRRGEAGSA